MDRKIEFGRSLYLTDGLEVVEQVLQEMQKDQQTMAFTSFQLPEEPMSIEDMIRIVRLSVNYQVDLIPDIAHATLTPQNIQQLKEAGLRYLRLDEFLDEELLKNCAEYFELVVNASTLQYEQLELLKSYQKKRQIIACHNYYPKPFTGLSIERVQQVNQRLKSWGVKIIAFIAGDEPLRAPLQEGLPTVEEHRTIDKRIAISQLVKAETDVILVGDSYISDQTKEMIQEFAKGYVSLQADVPTVIKGTVFYDRPDVSEYIFRMVGTRQLRLQDSFASGEYRLPGELYQANENYGRYMGELELVKKSMPSDSRQNKIGELLEDELSVLIQLPEGIGIRFV